MPKDHNGPAAIHDTPVDKVFARWSADGSREPAFIARGAHRSEPNHLALSVRHGDGTNTVAKKGHIPSLLVVTPSGLHDRLEISTCYLHGVSSADET